MTTRYYWDSCLFIDRIQGTPGRIEVLEPISQAASAGKLEIVTSTLAIAEVCKFKDSDASIADQAKAIRLYFENNYILVYQVTRHIAEQAADIARTFGIKPHDAIHIATAIHAKVRELHTYDGSGGKGGKLIAYSGRIGDPPLTITTLHLPPLPPALFES